MGWSCDSSSMDGVCYVLAIVVVAVLVYLGCSEMRRTSTYAAARRASKAGRAATNAPADDASAPPPRRTLSGIPVGGTDMDEAFAELDVDRSMTRTVDVSTYQVPQSVFMQEFVDGDKSSFRPPNKEAALRSANTRPAQHMKNGRDNGVKSRTVGLYGMAFAGRGPIERPVGSSSCIAFGDTDTRQHMVMQATDCAASESCPWQKQQ